MNLWVLAGLFLVGLAASFSLQLHIHQRLESDLERRTHFLNERITMSTQAQLDALVSQLNKAHKEICDRITAAQEDLQAQLVAAGVSEDAVDLSALAVIAQQLDDVVPDAPASVEELTDSVTESVDEFEAESEVVEVDEVDEVVGEAVGEVDEVAVDEAVEVVDEVEVDEVVTDEAVDEVEVEDTDKA
jgi:hypothetical protein